MPHNVEIPDYVIERVMAKRGRRHVFERFEPAETAMVVIDMQNFFVADVEMAVSVVPNINRLAGVVRERGGLVAWVSAGKSRKRARLERQRANRAEKELAEAKDHIHRLELEADEPRSETPSLPDAAA